MNFETEVWDVCNQIAEMVIEKNRKYGNSALDPVRVFSKLDREEGMLVRMDDKLSRIREGAADEDEDPILDLAGYIVLLLVGRRSNG